MVTRIVRRSLVVLALCCTAGLAQAVPQYDIMPFDPQFKPTAVSLYNVVIGTYSPRRGEPRAALAILEGGRLRYEMLDPEDSEGVALNNRSASLVRENDGRDEQYWILLPDRVLRVNIPDAEVTGINDALQTVGTIDGGNGIRAFRATRDTIKYVKGAQGLAIAQDGTVLLGIKEDRVQLWLPNGKLSKGIPGRLHSMSPNGKLLAGETLDGDTALLWKNGAFTKLGTHDGDERSSATSVNDNGDVVGAAAMEGSLTDLDNEDLFAFLYSDGEFHDLNDLLTRRAERLSLTLVSARQITNNGSILAVTRDDSGDLVNVLLVPAGRD